MSESETKELLNFFNAYYPNFKSNSEMIKIWATELSQYDFDDVKGKVNELLELNDFIYTSPPLKIITRDLQKVKDKIDFKKMILYCKICNKEFNNYDKLILHEDRCRSIKYIKKQYLKLANKIVDEKKLYEMSNKEFDKNYNNFLKTVLKTSTDEKEKIIITKILCPDKNIKNDFFKDFKLKND